MFVTRLLVPRFFYCFIILTLLDVIDGPVMANPEKCKFGGKPKSVN